MQTPASDSSTPAAVVVPGEIQQRALDISAALKKIPAPCSPGSSSSSSCSSWLEEVRSIAHRHLQSADYLQRSAESCSTLWVAYSIPLWEALSYHASHYGPFHPSSNQQQQQQGQLEQKSDALLQAYVLQLLTVLYDNPLDKRCIEQRLDVVATSTLSSGESAGTSSLVRQHLAKRWGPHQSSSSSPATSTSLVNAATEAYRNCAERILFRLLPSPTSATTTAAATMAEKVKHAEDLWRCLQHIELRQPPTTAATESFDDEPTKQCSSPSSLVLLTRPSSSSSQATAASLSLYSAETFEWVLFVSLCWLLTDFDAATSSSFPSFPSTCVLQPRSSHEASRNLWLAVFGKWGTAPESKTATSSSSSSSSPSSSTSSSHLSPDAKSIVRRVQGLLLPLLLRRSPSQEKWKIEVDWQRDGLHTDRRPLPLFGETLRRNGAGSTIRTTPAASKQRDGPANTFEGEEEEVENSYNHDEEEEDEEGGGDSGAAAVAAALSTLIENHWEQCHSSIAEEVRCFGSSPAARDADQLLRLLRGVLWYPSRTAAEKESDSSTQQSSYVATLFERLLHDRQQQNAAPAEQHGGEASSSPSRRAKRPRELPVLLPSMTDVGGAEEEVNGDEHTIVERICLTLA